MLKRYIILCENVTKIAEILMRKRDKLYAKSKFICFSKDWCENEVVRDSNNLLEKTDLRVPENSILLIRPDKIISAIYNGNNLYNLSDLLNNNEIFSF